MTAPVRPTNARLVRADGEVIPLELAYIGIDDNGIHIWSAASTYRLGDCVLIDRLPAHSRVEFEADMS